MYAIIDLGTNGFRLQIAKANEKARTFETIFKENVELQLASGEIEKIAAEPFQRGLEVMRQFKAKVKEYPIDSIRALGTAALRTATNGKAFIKQVKKETGIAIQLISGKREAELIYKGMGAAYPIEAGKKRLMVDVGGGSVEFIIANHEKMLWSESFPVGVAILKKSFHHSDPITTSEISKIQDFLDSRLKPVINALKHYPVDEVSIASGTMDVLCSIINSALFQSYPYFLLARSMFGMYSDKMIPSPLTQLKDYAGMPTEKVDMFQVGLILEQYILEMAPVQTDIIVSRYSMTRGALMEMAFEKVKSEK